jgi:hypothetical protein
MKEGITEEETEKFEKSIKSLLAVESILSAHIGKPAATNRPVIDRSYSYSLLLIFQDKAGHDIYQPHPIHKKFVEECSPLWTRVLIYDSETIEGGQK